MPDGFVSLVIVCAIAIVVLKLIKASAKIILSAVALAAVVWFVINVLPTLGVGL